jgi:DNA-binding beta-propeller fold protein YncE
MKNKTAIMTATIGLSAVAAIVVGFGTAAAATSKAPMREVPQFKVDPSWPKKLPNNWQYGLVSGVNVDAQDHIWVLHRPRTITAAQKAIGPAAPPVLEFDMAGNYIKGWGGDGPGYEWPGTEHGISIDYKGFVWIGGSGTGGGRNPEPGDDDLLKFTKDGKFVMQIGHRGQSKGNTDTVNVHGPADQTVYPKTNEVFVADGYGNRRIIVFDADTGAFKRMWGAFGNVATDPPPSAGGRGRGARNPADDEGDGPQQFSNVHSARISNDGLVYVCDRSGKRVQVFTPEGKYVTQVFLSRGVIPPSTLQGMDTVAGKSRAELADGLARAGMTASRTAFSPDKDQKFLYVIDRIKHKIVILDRKTLDLLGEFGDGVGSEPGQFYVLHDIAADSKGNIYTAEVNDDGNRRSQKFTYTGMKKVAIPPASAR